MAEQEKQTEDDNVIFVWDNPAQQLLTLVDKIRAIPHTEPTMRSWHRALDSKSWTTLCRRLSLASALPDNALLLLRSLYPDLQEKTVQHWHAQTTNLFTGAFDQLTASWHNVMSKVDEHAHNGLISASMLIESKRHPKAKQADHLDETYALLSELEKEISADSDISPALKQQLLKIMASLKSAIEERFLTGLKPLEGAVDAAFGHTRFKEYNDFAASTKGEKFRAVVQDLANVVTIASTTIPAATLAYSSLLKLLPS